MAEMSKGRARSVPDLLGDRSQATHRQVRLQRERAEDAAAVVRSQHLANLRLPFEQRSATLDLTQRLEPTVTIGGQHYREVDNGRANVLVPVDDPLKANPRITTPGLRGGGAADRAHLLAKQLGGSGDLPQNLVTGSRMPTNQSWMKRFENGVARMVRGGEVVEYFVTPIYGPRMLPPRLIAMMARGSGGSQAARVVENPAGRPR